MNYCTPQDSMELCLGVEQGIKVKRLCKFNESQSGLIGHSSNIIHKISNTVQNTLPQDVEIEIRELLPVAGKDEKIKIHLDEVSPQWSELAVGGVEKEGLYKWRSKLAGAEKKDFKFSYTITLAAREELQGGNRREF